MPMVRLDCCILLICQVLLSKHFHLDDALIGDQHKVAVSTYLWEEESPDAWYDQSFKDSADGVHVHTLRYEESEKLPRTYLALFKVK